MSVIFAPTSAEILGSVPIYLICFRPSPTADKIWDFRETVKSLIVFDFPDKWKPGLLIGTLDGFTYNRLIYFTQRSTQIISTTLYFLFFYKNIFDRNIAAEIFEILRIF